jgi:cell shape-determining protein MreD
MKKGLYAVIWGLSMDFYLAVLAAITALLAGLIKYLKNKE